MRYEDLIPGAYVPDRPFRAILRQDTKTMIDISNRAIKTYDASSTPAMGAFFVGTTGTGKSSCMYAICKAVIRYVNRIVTRKPDHEWSEQQQALVYREGIYRPNIFSMRFGTLCEAILDAGKRGSPDPREVIWDSRFIFIDELTFTGARNWKSDVIAEIIQRVYDSGCQRIYFTSNNAEIELHEYLGATAYDRISDLCEVAVVNGPSFRGKHA